MLNISKLGYSFDGIKNIFSDVSFSLDKGEILSIIGFNGAGKTTFLRCVSQRFKDYKGEVIYSSINLKEISIKERAKVIGFATINEQIESDILVDEYLCMGFVSQISYYSTPRKQQYRKVYEICKEYGYAHLLNRNIRTLSQGECQIASILRVLIQNPDIIIFDEPTAALDLKNQRILLDIMKKMSLDGKIIIHVTHNPNHVFELGGKVLVLGKDSYMMGDVDVILTEDNLSDIYDMAIRVISFDGKKNIIY